MPTEFEIGVFVGVLIGEGHFGGDGRQPHITLRMHIRHESLFRWIERTFPGGRLYGPYNHGGREYFQWMARGTYLRDEIVPLLTDRLGDHLDARATARFVTMRANYSTFLAGGTVSAVSEETEQHSTPTDTIDPHSVLPTPPTPLG